MGVHWGEQQIDIAAPREACFDAIVDYESFPAWQRPVIATEVIDRHDDGLARRVRLKVDARLRTVTYVLDYFYERPERIWWEFVEGNGVERIEGEYRFEDRGGTTRATYRVGIDPGVPVPGLIARKLNRGVMRESVEELKAEAERRADSGG
jgi:uncharacterized membrane protein